MKHTIKQLANDLSNTQLIPLSVITACSLLIWYGGSSLVLGHYAPLADTEKRFYCILLIFFSWLVSYLFFKPAQKDSPIPTVKHPDFLKKLHTLEGRFDGAVSFLKKTVISKHGKESSLHHLPWYLLIGLPNSGKTTLMANAGINFILSKQFKANSIDSIPPSDVCDWWVTRDLVMIDVPGCYLQAKSKQVANSAKKMISWNHLLWKNAIQLTQKIRGQRSLQGAVIALAIPDILSQNADYFSQLSERIKELQQSFGNQLAFYFTITKCDKIPGFTEFFGDSGVDELTQAWGVSLTSPKEGETILDVFNYRLNALIKRLNKQLIWRLHQERNANERPKIKDFPLQVERIKESLINILKLIVNDNKSFKLQGIYLNSAIQPVQNDEATIIQGAASSQQSLQILHNPIMPSKAYFIRQFLLQGLPTAIPEATTLTHKRSKQHPLVYAAALAIGVLAALFFGQDIHHSLNQTYAIQDGLANYRLNLQQASEPGVHLEKALPLLTALQLAAASSSHSMLLYSDKAQQSAQSAYVQALQTIVMPQLKYDLENYLKTATTHAPEPIYAALKVYLMLANKNYLDLNAVTQTMQAIHPALFAEHADKVNAHIHAAFNIAWQPVSLDPELISNARKLLTSLPPTQLGFIILKNMDNNAQLATIKIATHLKNTPEHSILTQLPRMFTAAQLDTILSKQIPLAASQASQGDWILGGYSAAFTDRNTVMLAEQLRSLYLKTYASAWENLMTSTTFSTPTTLAESAELIHGLVDANSPISQWLMTIKQNTYFAPVMAASPALLQLNTFIASHAFDQQNSTSIFKPLEDLDRSLQKIITSDNINKASFDAAVARMNNTTNDDATSKILRGVADIPHPLNQWISRLTNKSWQFTLANANTYIHSAWQKNVMTAYNATLATAYPFSKTAVKDSRLTDVQNFLGPHGSYTDFYNQYLSPFVNTSSANWQLMTKDNASIAISTAALTKLQAMNNLQRALFKNNQLMINFTLKPQSLDKHSKAIRIEMNGESIHYDKATLRMPQQLSWPANKDAAETVLSFISMDNKSTRQVFRGDWGWFKLVNQAYAQSLNAKVSILTISLNTQIAKYLLITQDDTNPFLVQNFSVPEQL